MSTIRLYKDAKNLEAMTAILSNENIPFYVVSSRTNQWFSKNPGHVFFEDEGFNIWADNPGEEDYTFVDAFVTGDFTEQEFSDLEDILLGVEDLDLDVLDKFRIETQALELKEDVVTHKNNYDFRTIYIEGRDCMMYEVCKPFTDVPYTTGVFNFKEAGHLQFFSALFTIGSWGICREDMDFLFNVWKHLNMPGEYNIENIVKEATEECARGKVEPRVYRRTIEQVLQRWDETNFIGLRSNKAASRT